MSIATQTPEGKSTYSPTKEDKLFDAPKARDTLGRASLASVVALSERNSIDTPATEEKIERAGPVYTFDNYMALREQVAELNEQVANQIQEFMAIAERVSILKDARDDLGPFASAEDSLLVVEARLGEAEADVMTIRHEMTAKQKARDKFLKWQDEVENDLKQRNDKSLQAFLDAQVARPSRLGG